MKMTLTEAEFRQYCNALPTNLENVKPTKSVFDHISHASSFESSPPTSIAFMHEWTIEHFRDFYNSQITGYPKIRSQPFSPHQKDEWRFGLVLCPKGDGSEYQNHMSVYLRLVECPTDEVIIYRSFAILDENGCKCNAKGKNYAKIF